MGKSMRALWLVLPIAAGLAGGLLLPPAGAPARSEARATLTPEAIPTVEPAIPGEAYPAPEGDPEPAAGVVGPAVTPAPPAPPAIVWIGGVVVAIWPGPGTLHEALGLRPLWAAPLVCRSSPCAPPVEPGAALIVSGPGGESAAAVVPPRPRGAALLPLVRR